MINVIQIGIGGMGNTWLRAIGAADNVQHVAYVEVNPEIIEVQSKEWNIDKKLIFPTLQEALAVVKADAVIDVTPPAFHRPNAEVALNAGVPVLCEKPLSDKLEDAEAIVRLSTETGVMHMVAQNYRYNLPMQTIKRLLDGGTIGQVGQITINFYKGLHFTGFRRTLPYPLTIDMSIHHFDLMRYLLGSNPIKISGRSWRPIWSEFVSDPATTVVLEFQNGVVASYNGSWSSIGFQTSWNGNWRIEGTEGVLELNDDVITVQKPTKKLDYGYEFSELEEIPVADAELDNQRYLLQELHEVVTKGIFTPGTIAQDNIYSLRTVFGAVEAFESGDIVDLEP